MQAIAPCYRNTFHAIGRRNLRRDTGLRRSTTKNNAKHPDASPSPPPTSASPSSSSSSISILQSPLQWYITKLDTHPLTTKCISSGLISGAGDLLCQYLVHNPKKADDATKNEGEDQEDEDYFDWIRTLRFTILGSFLVAPTVHAWYGHLMTSVPGSGVSGVLKRLFYDQGLFAPIFLPTFISCLTLLEHVSPTGGGGGGDGGDNNNHKSDFYTHLTSRLKNDVPEALVVGWSIWIPSIAIMFAFVPFKFQVLYSNGIGFVWNAYLSWRTHEGEVELEGESEGGGEKCNT